MSKGHKWALHGSIYDDIDTSRIYIEEAIVWKPQTMIEAKVEMLISKQLVLASPPITVFKSCRPSKTGISRSEIIKSTGLL